MIYRALLNDPGAQHERPVQVFGNSRSVIDEWTQLQLAKAIAPNAAVTIYQTVEQQIAIVLKPKKEADK